MKSFCAWKKAWNVKFLFIHVDCSSKMNVWDLLNSLTFLWCRLQISNILYRLQNSGAGFGLFLSRACSDTLNSYTLSSITSFFCQYLLLCHCVSILYLCFPVTTLISETRMAKIKWLPMSFMIKISQNALNVVTVPSTCSYSTSCSSLYASVNV